MTERELQQTIIEAARALGFLVAHFRPAQARSGRWMTPMQGDVGFPDLVICGHGALWFVELKAGKGRLSDAQARWIDHLDHAMAHAYVLRPADLDWFLSELKAARESLPVEKAA